MASMIPSLTVVIPFRDGHATIVRLFDSLPPTLPVIVVDDLSAQPLTISRPNVRVIRRETRGFFSGAVNTGLRACTTDALILNQDSWLEGDEWQSFIAENRDAGIAGDGVTGHPAHIHNYVQGTFMYVSRKALDTVGLLNETDWPLWGGSCELQLRMCRHGFTAVPRPIVGFHHERVGAYGDSIQRLLAQEPDNKGLYVRTPPLVSVVMACFNYGRFLSDAVNSLRGGPTSLGQHKGQTFQGFEVVIVDDASTDDTPQIAQGLADSWQGIRYIRLPHNVGTAAAYNAGIKASYGRYFMMLSADDMLEPTALDAMYRILEDDAGAVAYTDLQLFADGKRGKVWQMQEYNFEALLERNHVPAGIMASKAAWQAVGGYPAKFRFGREDWAMAVALGQAGHCGVRIPEPLYLYRRAGQNRSATNGTAEWREHFVSQMRETFPDLYKGERPMGCCGGSKRAARTVQVAPRGGVKMAAMRAGENGMTLLEYIGGNIGMTLLEYIGGNIGKASWWGPVTATRYEFGLSKRIGYVDDRDLAAMLDVVQGRRPVFKRYVQPENPRKTVEGKSVGLMGLYVAEPVKVAEPVTPEPIIVAKVLQIAPEILAVIEKPKRTRKAKNV